LQRYKPRNSTVFASLFCHCLVCGFVHLLTGIQQHGVKNAVTIFHKPSSPGSSRILNILKQAHATAGTHATEDQASSHQSHSDAQKTEFDLEVAEGPPTSDQLRSILDYVGETNANKIVEGASDTADAQRRLRANANSFQRPLVRFQ
jgi:hypothetical protein